jgi:hypothetical protein
MARRTGVIERLEEHPNLPEVLGVLAQLAHITDDDLPPPGRRVGQTVAVAAARDRALSPDSPLVCEVLAAFDALSALFEDDLVARPATWWSSPASSAPALKAVRDALAAVYARPILSRTEYTQLLAPWRASTRTPRSTSPTSAPAPTRSRPCSG